MPPMALQAGGRRFNPCSAYQEMEGRPVQPTGFRLPSVSPLLSSVYERKELPLLLRKGQTMKLARIPLRP